ncbi:MAG: hypothetical protein MUC91_04930 [Verrucomicrobia bacterium]|nr:hypothetical protein [Verrucomicrobiota bacterium]
MMIAYALALFYFAANPSKIVNRRHFRWAWILFGIIPLITALFTLLRTFTVGFTRYGAVFDLISTGLSWLLLGVSWLVLLKALLPRDTD